MEILSDHYCFCSMRNKVRFKECGRKGLIYVCSRNSEAVAVNSTDPDQGKIKGNQGRSS